MGGTSKKLLHRCFLLAASTTAASSGHGSDIPVMEAVLAAAVAE